MSAPLPVYLVKGSDPTLRAHAISKLVTELVGEGEQSLMVEEYSLDGDVDELAIAVDAARTPPFLAERRVVVVREVTAASTDALQPLVDYIAYPLASTSLVLVTGDKGRLSSSLASAVKQVGHVISTDVPQQQKQRGTWLADQMQGAAVKLDAAAIAVVDAHLGNDLGRLWSLLETLEGCFGQGARLGVDDVSPFLGEPGDVPPWELTDAIDRGDASGAIDALQRMMGAGERHPLQVMAVLHGHYAKMLRLDGSNVRDEAGAAQLLDMKGSTYPAKKALNQCRRLGHQGVAEAIRLLADADLDLRGVKAWPEQLVLEVLVARLSRLGPRSRSGRS